MLNSLINAGLKTWADGIRIKQNLPVRLSLWSGGSVDLGQFKEPVVHLHVKEPSALPMLMEPSLDSLGEAYIKQKIDIEGSLRDIIDVAYRLSAAQSEGSGLASIVKRFTHSKEEDKEAIQYHYDVSNEFYRCWLDQNMVYSCAYFENGDETLEEAQLKKIDHILTKIRLKRGQNLLDIGCGWGALVIRAAEKFGANCIGITLSQNQYDLARKRVSDAGLSDRIEIRLQDYRDVTGKFDRITSVGMFEHVGKDNLPAYFKKVCDLLADDGIVMNHGITASDPDNRDTSALGGDFIDKYVFPSGELPHVSLAMRTMQQGGLEPLDAECLRRHYARTLTCWAERFENCTEAIRSIVGETRYRIWRVYLAGCAHAFAIGNVSIFQLVAQKAGRDADSIPWSRRYVYAKNSAPDV